MSRLGISGYNSGMDSTQPPHALRANVLSSLRKLLPGLRQSEQKVANFVLANSSKVTGMRIVDLAGETEVSEPTVVRFCRSLGYRSFQQFKLNLAQSLAVSPALGQFNISARDSSKTTLLKVFDATINNLLAVRNTLSVETLDKAVKMLQQAKHLELYGYGTSAAIATDAQHKFFRLIHSTIAHNDPHVQCMSAANMPRDSVIIAISQSGRSRGLLQATEIARANEVGVIAICPGQTPLARDASIHLEVDITDDFNMFSTMASRIVHLTILDLLVVNMAMRTGRIETILRKMSESQRSLFEPEVSSKRKTRSQTS